MILTNFDIFYPKFL